MSKSKDWNPNQGTDDAVDKTRVETTPSNAGPDALMGTVADQPPEDPDNPPMDSHVNPPDEGEGEGAKAKK